MSGENTDGRWLRCAVCKGSGQDSVEGSAMRCLCCGGHGKVWVPDADSGLTVFLWMVAFGLAYGWLIFYLIGAL